MKAMRKPGFELQIWMNENAISETDRTLTNTKNTEFFSSSHELKCLLTPSMSVAVTLKTGLSRTWYSLTVNE